MIVRSFLLLFSPLIAILANDIYAKTKSEHIQASVVSYMKQHKQKLMTQYGPSVRIDYEISSLDPRLSMTDCGQPLTVKLKSQDAIGRVNLKVSCLKPSPWSLYVPTEIKLYRQVVVTTLPLPRGTKLSTAMLQLREMDISRLRGTYYTRINDVLGMQTKRMLQPDTLISSYQVEPPIMIKKGESVLVTANSGNLKVKMPGIALANGRLGQQISVRNRQSKRVVEAKVTAPGQVAVPM